MAKRICTWFVEPLDSHTNAVFARELPEEDLCQKIFCADGFTRTFWRCPWPLVKFFWESRVSEGLNFEVLNICGLNRRIAGRVRIKTFLLRKKYLTKPKPLTKSTNSV
jgi:hypothetical protein